MKVLIGDTDGYYGNYVRLLSDQEAAKLTTIWGEKFGKSIIMKSGEEIHFRIEEIINDEINTGFDLYSAAAGSIGSLLL